LQWFLITLARLVLPQPGGPQKTMLGTFPLNIAALNILVSPKILCCPKNSSKFWGRILSARGIVVGILGKFRKLFYYISPYGF
jgi:hypothetical protein